MRNTVIIPANRPSYQMIQWADSLCFIVGNILVYPVPLMKSLKVGSEFADRFL